MTLAQQPPGEKNRRRTDVLAEALDSQDPTMPSFVIRNRMNPVLKARMEEEEEDHE